MALEGALVEDRAACYERMVRAQADFDAVMSALGEVRGRVREVRVEEEEVGFEWRLSGRVIPVVEDYRFLGVRLKNVKRARWSLRREEMLVKSKGAFWRAWGLGLDTEGWVSARGAKALWEMLVRSVLEYGAEVDSERWEEAEKLQVFAGRLCLGVGREVPNAVVLGGLGWVSVQARREVLRLRYWGKIVREGRKDPDSPVWVMYQEGRRRMMEGRTRSKNEWCVETQRLLQEVGLGESWETEEVDDRGKWNARVRSMVMRREERRWRELMWGGGRNGMALTTLERYARIKTALRSEWFLGRSRVWVSRWVRMRGGVQGLEVVKGRRRTPQVRREERVCRFCEGGEVEDEEHFWMRCPGWSERRGELWRDIGAVDREVVRTVMFWDEERRLDWLMCGGNKKVSEVVLRGMVKWMFERKKCEVTMVVRPRAPSSHTPPLSPTTIITSYEEQVESAAQVVAALWIAVEEQTDMHI